MKGLETFNLGVHSFAISIMGGGGIFSYTLLTRLGFRTLKLVDRNSGKHFAPSDKRSTIQRHGQSRDRHMKGVALPLVSTLPNVKNAWPVNKPVRKWQDTNGPSVHRLSKARYKISSTLRQMQVKNTVLSASAASVRGGCGCEV